MGSLSPEGLMAGTIGMNVEGSTVSSSEEEDSEDLLLGGFGLGVGGSLVLSPYLIWMSTPWSLQAPVILVTSDSLPVIMLTVTGDD